MGSEVTNAPALPGKDPLTPGEKTTEFGVTVATLVLSSVLALLAAFNVIHLTPEQEAALYKFVGVAWTVLPAVYVFARSHVKGKAVAQSAINAITNVASGDK